MGLAAVTAALALMFLFVVPLPHSFSATLVSGTSSHALANLTFPRGAQVSGSWKTLDGGLVVLTILNSSGDLVLTSDAAAGAFSFTADGGTYLFGVYSSGPESTSVHGSYSIPVLKG